MVLEKIIIVFKLFFKNVGGCLFMIKKLRILIITMMIFIQYV